MLQQARADEAARRAGQRSAANQSAANMQAGESESYWQWTQRQLNERTEKLGIMGDSMDNLQKNSSGFADDVNKFVSKQKRNLVMGAVKGKLGM